MHLLKSVKRRPCDVFVDVAASLTRETVLFNNMRRDNDETASRKLHTVTECAYFILHFT